MSRKGVFSFREAEAAEKNISVETLGLRHVEVSLNYCSQNGGNLYRAP